MTEYKDDLPEDIPDGIDAVMSVAVKTEKGFTLTRDYGFTVEEEAGKVLAFDILVHPDLGTTVLFGNQVFALKYWDKEDLHKGLQIISKAVKMELERRKDDPQTTFE
jgi:hypothetical protein